MKIYGDLISPYVRMSMVTAYEAGIEDRIEFVMAEALLASVSKELSPLSPIGQMPVLQTDDGQVLYDSRVIMEYFCHVAGNSQLLPDAADGRFRVLTLLAMAQGVAEAGVRSRDELTQRPKELHWQAWLERLRKRVEAALDELEERWHEDLMRLSVGSIGAAVALSYVDFRFGIWSWRSKRPKLAAFHETFTARTSMQKTRLV